MGFAWYRTVVCILERNVNARACELSAGHFHSSESRRHVFQGVHTCQPTAILKSRPSSGHIPPAGTQYHRPQIPASHKVIGDHGLESVRDMFELKNKNFVVTGGGRGIGYAVNRAIAEMGGNVAVIDVLDAPVKDWETLPQQINKELKLEYIK